MDVRELTEMGREKLARTQYATKEALAVTEDYIKTNPWIAVAVAAVQVNINQNDAPAHIAPAGQLRVVATANLSSLTDEVSEALEPRSSEQASQGGPR